MKVIMKKRREGDGNFFLFWVKDYKAGELLKEESKVELVLG